MNSSSNCFCIVSIIVLLQLFLVSASTKYIDTICNTDPVQDKTFCIKTLTASAKSATDLVSVVKVALRIGMSQAKKVEGFIAQVSKSESTVKECFYSYRDIVLNLISAFKELKEDPMTASYDAMRCFDGTHDVKNLIGKNSDKDSKNLMKMTLMMDKFIEIAAGATNALSDSQSLKFINIG